MKPLYEVSSTIRTGPAAARSALQNWRAGELSALLGASADDDAYVNAQPIADGVRLEGHWWYRGELTVEYSASRTLLVYRVFNIASRARWAVRLANRFFIGGQNAARQQLRIVADRLDAGQL